MFKKIKELMLGWFYERRRKKQLKAQLEELCKRDPFIY